LLFGSYAPPPGISQLSPSTILRRDTYESVLGNAFHPVAPTGLAPRAPISLPTLFPCLPPPVCLLAQTDLLASVPALHSDPLQSTSPPERPLCVPREEDPDPHITVATPRPPRGMGSFIGPGVQHQRSSLTSPGIQHQLQPQSEYPTYHAGSMDHSKRQGVDDGQSPSVAQQQHQMAVYPSQLYHSPAPAHWYGGGAQLANAPISQPPQPRYWFSSTPAGPSYSHHAHPSHAPTRNPSMYAAPIPTVPSRGGSTQGQEQYYYFGTAAYSHPTQAYRRPPYISPTHVTGMCRVHTPAGSSGSGIGSIARPTPPMLSGPIPHSAIVPRPLSLSAGSEGRPAGYPAAASAVGSQAPHRSGSGGNPMGTGHTSGHTAPVMMDSLINISGADRFEHGPFEFPPNPYPGGEKGESPWWPTRKTEYLYGSRLDQVRRSLFFLSFSSPPSLHLPFPLLTFLEMVLQ